MRLIKDSAIYVLGEIFTKSIPFFLLPYLTRVLGKEGFGELSLYQSVITLLIVFIGLSQDGAIARYYYFYGKRSLGLIAVTGGLLSFLIMLMIVIFSFFYLENIYCYIAFSAFIQSLLSVQLSVRQCQKKAMSYFYIQLFNGILSVVFTVSILQLISPTPVARIIAILLSGFFVVIFLGVYFYNDNRVIYSMKNYRSALIYITSFGLPLIIHQLGFFIKGQFDRLFIYKKYSFADLGLYSSAVQVATVLPVILLALNKAIVPYIYDALKSEVINIRKIRMWGVWSLAFVPIPSFLAFIIPESFYTFILGADFNGAKYYIVLMLLAYGFNIPYLIIINYYFYNGRNNLIATITMSSSAIYILSLFLFSTLGLEFIPYATLLSNFMLAVFLVFFDEAK